MAAKVEQKQPETLAAKYVGPHEEVALYDRARFRDVVVKQGAEVELSYSQAMNLKMQAWDGNPEEVHWEVPGITDKEVEEAYRKERNLKAKDPLPSENAGGES